MVAPNSQNGYTLVTPILHAVTTVTRWLPEHASSNTVVTHWLHPICMQQHSGDTLVTPNLHAVTLWRRNGDALVTPNLHAVTLW